MGRETCLDCDEGRALGCGTYCCRLLVRLTPEEVALLFPDDPSRRFADKDPDGMCSHLDRETGRCTIWEMRPQVCREYDCNEDSLLDAALEAPFRNIVELVQRDVSRGGRRGRERVSYVG